MHIILKIFVNLTSYEYFLNSVVSKGILANLDWVLNNSLENQLSLLCRTQVEYFLEGS